MLYPQSNPFRTRFDLSGFWDFAFDPEDRGLAAGWHKNVPTARPIAVPASWNDQFDEGRDYLGASWYQTRFDLPWNGSAERQVRLRFGSANYMAQAWLNGVPLGWHEGGHLPFEFDVTPHLAREGNVLIVRVEGELAPNRVPPGKVVADPQNMFIDQKENYPQASFDFFPFCGIHRPVLLYATAPDALADLTVVTELAGGEGRVRVQIKREAGDAVAARVTLKGHGANVTVDTPLRTETGVELRVPKPALWEPGSPNLYDLTVELIRNGELFDRYTLPIGLRTIRVDGDALLLNDKPMYLKGFGRHEDFPITGRGFFPAVIVKDYALMQWVGANSFRTTHYPYSEEMMALADRLGLLVIDETPAVGLYFANETRQRQLELCRQYTQELIARDKNHSSVILWSLANEPHSEHPAAKPFFRDLFDLARSLDGTRPVTLASYKGMLEESFEFCDVLCLNRYYGWYSESGQVDAGCAKLSEELDALHAKFGKPLILTEFGADTIAGVHAQPPEMFSEEFQADLIEQYVRVLRSKPFVIGEHVWNMCDFKTSQSVRRPNGLNLKGVFTRDRRPKMAAHRLRQIWGAQ